MSAKIRTRFFAFGLPKSGTTWLQMLLDAHPEVSCPTEHQLSYVLESLPKLVNNYNIVLQEIDRRTANSGATPLGNTDLMAITRAIVEACIQSGARRKGAGIAGIKDNTVGTHFALFRDLYPDARYLCIVRDPRDAALSSWHHNNRVEPGFRDRAPSFADWAAQTWTRWVELYGPVLAATGGRDEGAGILLLRYEDLTGSARNATLIRCLAHLGLEIDGQCCADLFAATDIDRLRRGPAASFYRMAGAGGWQSAPERDRLPPPPEAARRLLVRFRYPAD